MALRATQIREQLTDLVGHMDVERISGADAAVLVRESSLIEKIAASARTLAATRVADTSAWVGSGDRSAEDWLSRETGTSVGAAARDLRTGKRVKDQAATQAAMKQGALSPEQAGAVAEAVAVDPAAETALIEAAKRETFKNFSDQARRTRAAATDDAERARRHHRERSAHVGTDDDGAFFLSLRGPASDGAKVIALLKPLQEQGFNRARSATAATCDTFANRCYDAVLGLLLGNASAAGGTGTDARASDGSDPSLFDLDAPGDRDMTVSSDPAGQPPHQRPPTHDPPNTPVQAVPPDATGKHPIKLPGGNNTKVIVRIDHAALLRGHTLAGETSEIAGLGPVPVTAVRDMLSDAFLAVVVTKGQDVVSVAHHGRGLNVHQRTAIEANGLRCSNISCNQSIGIQIDHRHPWTKDKITKLDNQDPLCGPCHRQKTHHGWHLEPGTGPRRFLQPAQAG